MERLGAVETRVLGSLLEKDIATPEYYPLTLHALVNACNQKSSRDPVVNYDEDTVVQALELLKAKGLALRISGAGHRVEKWSHRLGEALNLGRRELALLCVLMLRGPQTVGELRARTERMHDFADTEEVESVLESLAGRQPDPLTARGGRGRWMQMLSETQGEEREMAGARGAPGHPAIDARIEALEREVAELRREWERFRSQFE
ncbi:MAG TPA: YceH family protein [Bryobacteraceae bacterium]|nr:YceH family protein [Bryobacteraceae bacterium]